MKRNNRLLNTLASVGLCVGLIYAYNMFTERQSVPDNTHISYEAQGLYRFDVLADGTVFYQSPSVAYRYHISGFALKRMLRVFKRADLFNLSAAGYGARTGNICTLTQQSGPQKISIPQSCDASIVQTAKAIEALDQATHFKAVVLGDKTAIARLDMQPYALPKDGPVRPLVNVTR